MNHEPEAHQEDQTPPERRHTARRHTERRHLTVGVAVPLDVLLLPPQEFNDHVDKTLHFVEGASELVRTAYRCLRLIGDLSHLCQKAQRTHLQDFPALDTPIRELRRNVENLETHIQIELDRISDRG